MTAFQSLVANWLWIFGLACVVATFSYVAWYRVSRRWRWGYALGLPRILVPLCVSLELFCIGLALNGLLAFQQAPWWEIAAWSALAILFAVQTVVYGLAGIRYGWDTPVEGRHHDGV